VALAGWALGPIRSRVRCDPSLAGVVPSDSPISATPMAAGAVAAMALVPL
jgi:hypothetical protein